MWKAFLTWLMFPVYVWQGARIRRRIERLRPPEGPLAGYFGPHAESPHIRLLVLGDSSAAGVGVDRMEDSLAVRLAERLHACLLYTSPSPRDQRGSRMPSSA